MSVVVLLGTGALIGLVALTAVVVVTLLTERPGPRDGEAPADSDGVEPVGTGAGDRSVV